MLFGIAIAIAIVSVLSNAGAPCEGLPLELRRGKSSSLYSRATFLSTKNGIRSRCLLFAIPIFSPLRKVGAPCEGFRTICGMGTSLHSCGLFVVLELGKKRFINQPPSTMVANNPLSMDAVIHMQESPPHTRCLVGCSSFFMLLAPTPLGASRSVQAMLPGR